MGKDMDVFVPQEGDGLDLYHRLHSYITFFDTSWEQDIIGANADEIRRFEKVYHLDRVQSKIPEAYSIFLNRMGECDGGLLTGTLPEAQISRKELTDDYIDALKFEPTLRESPYIPFCTCLMSGEELSFDLMSEDPENIVVTYYGSDLYGRTEDTLDKLLFRSAFRKFYINRFQQVKTQFQDLILIKFRIDERSKFDRIFPNLQIYHDFIRDLERRFQIEALWFCNQDGYVNDYYVGMGDGYILTMRHSGNTLFGTVSGNHLERINQILRQLSDIPEIQYGQLSPKTIF